MGEALPEAMRTVWRVRAAIDAALWGGGIVGCAVAIGRWHWPWWLVLGPVLGLLLHPGLQLLLVPYRYAFWRYLITPEAVYLKRGYVFRSEEAVPISRVQNVTLTAGPLLRWQHLQAVQIETASTTHEIAGVTETVAAALRKRIMVLAQEARDE